ncbi:MAG TPA: hypothetical protein VLQ93_16590 [Myxococcaceae bacterium]|nr:hypothetical protein [Myxococcaceae bacterium]
MNRQRVLLVPFGLFLALTPSCGGKPPDIPLSTLPPGATLPSGAECAARVQRSDWEPRPDNAQANQTRGTSGVRINGASEQFNALFAGRIDGDFTGTTDEIIQWGACKWGFDPEGVRAVAVQESWWRQSTTGDDGQSFGLLQVRAPVHEGTFPLSRDSTAFNVDYALAWRRACYEGDFTWMNGPGKRGGYAAGDEWGCIGAWFSGDWYDGDPSVPYSGARPYIEQVQRHLTERTWTQADFINGG